MRAGSIPAAFQRRHAQGNGRKARSHCDRAFFIIRRFCSDVDKFALPLPSPRLRLGEAQGRRPLRRGRELPARYPRSRTLCPTSSQHQIAPNASKPSYFVAFIHYSKMNVKSQDHPFGWPFCNCLLLCAFDISVHQHFDFFDSASFSFFSAFKNLL